jgi:hypothetical protein
LLPMITPTNADSREAIETLLCRIATIERGLCGGQALSSRA